MAAPDSSSVLSWRGSLRRKSQGKRCPFVGISEVRQGEVPNFQKGSFVNHKCSARVAVGYALVVQHIVGRKKPHMSSAEGVNSQLPGSGEFFPTLVAS